jgi:hypothetical protein
MTGQISLAKQVKKVLVGDHAVAEAVKLARGQRYFRIPNNTTNAHC